MRLQHLPATQPARNPTPAIAAPRLDDTLQWPTTTAAGAGHEGAKFGEEAVRWMQECAEEEGTICVYYLQ